MKNSNRKPFKFEARRLLAMVAMAATMTAVAQEKSQDPILRNYEFENCGYVDSEGKTVIPFIYEDGRPFCNGKAWVQKDGKWGMINAKGETVMDFQFDSTSRFSESIIFVRRDSSDVSQYMIYSHDGVRVNTKTFSSVRAETCGYIPVACNGKEGLLDLEGREVLPCVYDFVDNFAERKLRVRKDGRFSFLDENLNPLFNATFDYADYFINGMARIRKARSTGTSMPAVRRSSHASTPTSPPLATVRQVRKKMSVNSILTRRETKSYYPPRLHRRQRVTVPERPSREPASQDGNHSDAQI